MWVELTEIEEKFDNFDSREVRVTETKLLLNLGKILSVRPPEKGRVEYGCSISTEEAWYKIKESYESVRLYLFDQVQKSISVVSL